MEKEIKGLVRLLTQVYQGDVREDIQQQIRPLLAEIKQQGLLDRLRVALIGSGMSETEAQVLSGQHPYYTRWKFSMPAWHPIFILKSEHIAFMHVAADAVRTMFKVYDSAGPDQAQGFLGRIKQLMQDWNELEEHMVREENVVFPVFERHGLSEVTADKWDDHQRIRDARSAVLDTLDGYRPSEFQAFRIKLRDVMVGLNKAAGNHFSAEERDLFNKSLNLLDKLEWLSMRAGLDELGYTRLLPAPAPAPVSVEVNIPGSGDPEQRIDFESGSLSLKELEAMLDTLPVDITFVDRDDRVKYFNMVPERFFPRAKGVIGRQVRRCHPRKSLHMVDRILADFKSGARDSAEFWITIRGRFLYIRYFAVRDGHGEYLGTLEVTQDVTGIRALQGEKRLLD